MLGDLSKKYESNGDPGAVSSGLGDDGGISYGAYQFISLYRRKPDWTSPAGRFILLSKWKKEFNMDHKPGSKEFTKVWKRIAKIYPREFLDDQHEYIREVYYDQINSILFDRHQLILNNRHEAINDMLWSIAVQHGASGGANLISRAVGTQEQADKLIDEILVDKIYFERGMRILDENGESVMKYFSKNSKKVQESVERRFQREKVDVLSAIKKSFMKDKRG